MKLNNTHHCNNTPQFLPHKPQRELFSFQVLLKTTIVERPNISDLKHILPTPVLKCLFSIDLSKIVNFFISSLPPKCTRKLTDFNPIF